VTESSVQGGGSSQAFIHYHAAGFMNLSGEKDFKDNLQGGLSGYEEWGKIHKLPERLSTKRPELKPKKKIPGEGECGILQKGSRKKKKTL